MCTNKNENLEPVIFQVFLTRVSEFFTWSS